MPAAPLAATADPPLKPNQPTHRKEAPTIVRTTLWGSEVLAPATDPFAQNDGRDQRRDTGVDMHDGAAGEV